VFRCLLLIEIDAYLAISVGRQAASSREKGAVDGEGMEEVVAAGKGKEGTLRWQYTKGARDGRREKGGGSLAHQTLGFTTEKEDIFTYITAL
jgi:hypothetical protein